RRLDHRRVPARLRASPAGPGRGAPARRPGRGHRGRAEGRGRGRCDLHRRVDEHGTGGGASAASGGVQPLPGQRDDRGLREALGQGEELVSIREKARRTGASSVHIVDLREEFVRDFIFPMLRGNAVYEGAYLLGTSIARPLIARAQVEIAAKEGADAVAHGATGKGNDQVRFELTYAALAPHLRVIAPWREWELGSRTALIEFAKRHDIAVPVTAERRALESLTLDREVLHLRDSLVPRYAEMIYYGFWFSPERQTLQTFLDECARDVTGTVRLKLYKGNVTVVGRRSPRSLYRTDFATFEADTVYRQRDAEGFISLNALRLKIRAPRDRAGAYEASRVTAFDRRLR